MQDDVVAWRCLTPRGKQNARMCRGGCLCGGGACAARPSVSYPVRALGLAASNMPQPIVFVGGVHGSGKTTLSRLLAEMVPAAHVTAGALIREAAAPSHVVTVGPQDKAVPDVAESQAVLLRGLSAYRQRAAGDGRPLLLDGHFTLLNASGDVVDVPTDVFRAIAPVAVLLVEATARTVQERLAARATDAPSLEIIERLAERERQRAIATSEALGVPIWTLAGDGSAEKEALGVVVRLRGLEGGVS